MKKKLMPVILGIGVIFFGYVIGQDLKSANIVAKEYVVLSVYKGAVQVQELETGKKVQIYDDRLVRMALDGELKRGDIIKF